MLQSFFHSIHVITVIVLSRFQVSITDKPTWSNTSKDHHFHNVSIYYWDWVPINNSKQTKEEESSKIEATSKLFRYHDPIPEIISTFKREDRSYDHPPRSPRSRKHINHSGQKQHGCHTVSFRVCKQYTIAINFAHCDFVNLGTQYLKILFFQFSITGNLSLHSQYGRSSGITLIPNGKISKEIEAAIEIIFYISIKKDCQ